MTSFIANFWPAQVTDEFELRDEVQPPPDIIDGFEEYEVESILKKKINRKTHEVEYLVLWKGHPDDVSWERESNLTNCKDLIKVGTNLPT